MFEIEKKRKHFFKKIFHWVIAVSGCVILAIRLLAGIAQEKYLSEKNFDKSISSVRVVTYAGEPFRSLVSEENIITDREKLDELQRRMNEQNVLLKVQHPTSTVMFITYFGGSSVIAYVDGEVLGLDYGNVTLKVRELDALLQ